MDNCLIAGNGVPVVLLHGFCENNTCFNRQVLLLKDHYKVIVPNLLGSVSTQQTSNFSIDDMADAVALQLQQLGITKCVMIGHSMGGYVTLAYAKKYADILLAIGLLNSTATSDDDARKLKREQAKKVIEEKGAVFYAKNFIPNLFKHNTNSSIINPLIQTAETFTNQGLISQVNAMKNRLDSLTFLTQTNLPVFFGVGKHDELIAEKDMIFQASTCKQSYVAYLTKSAHMAHIEQPEDVATHLIKFIERVI